MPSSSLFLPLRMDGMGLEKTKTKTKTKTFVLSGVALCLWMYMYGPMESLQELDPSTPTPPTH